MVCDTLTGMKKKLIAVTAAVLVLAGCTAAPSDETSDSARTAPSSTPTATETVEPTAAPLAEQPEADETETEPMPAGEGEFLAAVYPAWRGALPSDSELIAAGNYACEQMTAGVAKAEVVAVEGASEDAMWNNSQLISAAGLLCTEFN